MNEKVDIIIGKRKLTVEMEGLTELEIISLAEEVSEKLAEVSKHNDKIADTSKLAILTALELASDLRREREASLTARLVAERKIEELAATLKSSLE
jgi:cell division protein ZapA (FtsZ GTPase activity inhibitor)